MKIITLHGLAHGLVLVAEGFYASAMAEMARHVGVCGSDLIKAIQRMESADQDS